MYPFGLCCWDTTGIGSFSITVICWKFFVHLCLIKPDNGCCTFPICRYFYSLPIVDDCCLICLFLQIECSSIIDYSEKIVKANGLDDGEGGPSLHVLSFYDWSFFCLEDSYYDCVDFK